MRSMCLPGLRKGIAWLVLAAIGVLSVPSVPAAGASSSPDEIARLVYTGRFDQAKKVLTTQSAGVANRPSEALGRQLQKYVQLENRREEVRVESYDENVKAAKDFLARARRAATQPASSQAAARPTTVPAQAEIRPDKAATSGGDKSVPPAVKTAKTDIERALTAARKAKYYAADQKKFGQLDWVKTIVELARKDADKYIKNHEWLRAGNIYAELATIYDDDKSYEKLTRDCALRVRLEATYKPKADWADQIKGIRLEILPDISFNIVNYYVEPPDFAKMITAGIQAVALVTETPKLAQVFPALKDPKKVAQFKAETGKVIEQINREKAGKKLSMREFYQAILKLILTSEDTIELPREMVIKEFMDAALGELDPFTNIIWPAEVGDFDKHTTGRFSGVGIQLSMENNRLKVITPIPGTPAYRAGIIPGDIIATINGETTDGITIDQAVKKITGPKGTKVTLGILHPWAETPRDYPLIRDTIIIQTVKGFRMDKDNNWQYLMDAPNEKIAYIRITSFTETTVSELEEALKAIRKKGAAGLILDLRFNPGGTLKAAVETVDLFINKGVIVSTKGRSVDPWSRSANPLVGGRVTDLPMVVLINGYSASAAEIVSGALQDHHRAWLIGERSFGKGSVQNVLPIPNDLTKLKMTTAYYYLPLGRCIHKKPDSKSWGVDPDLSIELIPSELRDVIDLERDAEIVTQVNGKKVAAIPAASAPAPTSAPESGLGLDEDLDRPNRPRKYPAEDVQLQAALVVMQARLATQLPWDKIPATRPAKSTIVVKSTP